MHEYLAHLYLSMWPVLQILLMQFGDTPLSRVVRDSITKKPYYVVGTRYSNSKIGLYRKLLVVFEIKDQKERDPQRELHQQWREPEKSWLQHQHNRPYSYKSQYSTPNRVGEKALHLMNEYKPPVVDWAPLFW